MGQRKNTVLKFRQGKPVREEQIEAKATRVLEKVLSGKRTEPSGKAVDVWSQEKVLLLKTHPGWFVAYQAGRRVALEPTVDRLVAALDKKLGTPRNPCEFHEIIKEPAVGRGPSPRVRTMAAGE